MTMMHVDWWASGEWWTREICSLVNIISIEYQSLQNMKIVIAIDIYISETGIDIDIDSIIIIINIKID
jgi:hypothetical protein